MKKNIYVKDIKAGEKICDFFFVTEKNVAFSQKGSPYLNLRLKDKTGELDGKVWDNAQDMDKVFRKGDFIYIQSRAMQYKNAIQLSVMSARKADDQEISTEEYFPVAKENPDKMFAELMTFVDTVETPPLKSLLQSFF